MVGATSLAIRFSQKLAVKCVRTALLFAVLLTAFLDGTHALAESKETIESKATKAIAVLIRHAPQSKELLDKAKGVLVFPHIVKMGFGVGAQYGEGVLRVDGISTGYYSTAGASFGLQLGAQTKSEAILFMSDDALATFQSGQGWEVGVNSSIAVVKLGKGGKIDSSQWRQPVLAFIFSNQGLMGDLSLEGSKITRIAR
ncbi:MAG: YSC84-related protein [Halioglobus sp.]